MKRHKFFRQILALVLLMPVLLATAAPLRHGVSAAFHHCRWRVI